MNDFLIYEIEGILCIDLRDSSGKIISQVIGDIIWACKEVKDSGLDVEVKISKENYG
jgi:hypothetical protein